MGICSTTQQINNKIATYSIELSSKAVEIIQHIVSRYDLLQKETSKRLHFLSGTMQYFNI